VRVRVEQDPDCDGPLTWGQWELRLFDTCRIRTGNGIIAANADDYFRSADSWGDIGDVPIGVQARIRAGNAEFVRLDDHGSNGYRFHATERRPNGILWYVGKLEGNPIPRGQHLESMIETIDHWVQGECYGYTITDETTGEEDSCWGFIGAEHIGTELASLCSDARILTIDGDSAWVVSKWIQPDPEADSLPYNDNNGAD